MFSGSGSSLQLARTANAAIVIDMNAKLALLKIERELCFIVSIVLVKIVQYELSQKKLMSSRQQFNSLFCFSKQRAHANSINELFVRMNVAK